MNLPAALVLSSLALGVGGVSAYLAFGPAPAAQAAEAAAEEDGLAELRATVAELSGTVKALAEQPEMAPVTSRQPAAIDEEMLARAIAAYMETSGAGAAAAAAPLPAASPSLGTPADLALMLSEADDSTSAELWKKIVAAGLDDEVLAQFKALAEAAPGDPEAQLALGNAYLGRCQEAGAGPLAGKYATLADQALDAALEADPQHWESRFTKAAALSFWPPILGKQPEAIQQFETLLGQQAGAAPEPHHAQTHLLLGTLYSQTGQTEKAMATWQTGIGLFPSNAELAKQIALASQGQ